jgi:hypothetical protein
MELNRKRYHMAGFTKRLFRRRKFGLFFAAVIVFIMGLEIFLRVKLGFCDAILIQEDPDYEYIAKPNQSRHRFGNRILYNSKGMRSEEPDTSATIILGFGDSVINGGTQTDHRSLATTILSDSLTAHCGQKVQFLNISAGSWGPDNCFSYLNKHGSFDARSIFLFVSSHDAYDNMSFKKIVGVNKSFPSEQYSLAIFELVARYLHPRILGKFMVISNQTDELGINKREDETVFNPGFEQFLSYSRSNDLPLIIYLHADRGELVSRAYNEQGQEIIRFANQHDIPIILSMGYDFDNSDFRDNIHLNGQGQIKLARAVSDFDICKLIDP